MDEAFKANVTKGETWMRLVYMVLFAIVVNVAEIVVAVIAVVQFLSKLFSGRINEQLAEFGEGLSIYFRQIVAFLTFRTEDKPFPFAPWPETPAKAAEPPPDGVIEL